MKSVMISIQPQWVEKILNGEKTIEIRKTMPKCELPIKVYIYCTKGKNSLIGITRKGEELPYSDGQIADKDVFYTIPKTPIERWSELGKVVAEFTLNKITKHDKNFIDCEDNLCYNFKVCDVKNAGFETDCLSLIDFDNFVEDYGKGKTLYGWHIDNLKIYDKPKELSEFILPNKKNCKTCFFYSDICNKVCEETKLHLFRPPQSWCYCEGVSDDKE